MSETAPLKHIVEPGEYRCVWTIEDDDGNSRNVHGDIELRVDRPPRGSAYGDVPLKIKVQGSETMTTYPQRFRFPKLSGELVGGQKITLIDAVLHVWNFDRAAVGARAALVGPWDLGATGTFDRARVQVSGLDSLAGTNPIKSFDFPMENSLSGRWGVEANPERFQEWVDSSAKVELGYIGSASIGDPFKFSIGFSPSFTLKLTGAQSFDAILKDWVGVLQRLAALCTGRKSQITFVALGSGEPTHLWSQLYGVGIHQSPYASSRSELLDTKAAFTVKQDEISLLDLIRRWQKMVSDHHPLIETYGTFLSMITVEHPRNRFLQLIQALEGLYGYEYAEDIQDRVDKYLINRAEVIGRLKEMENLERDDLKFLKASVMRRPPASLNEPLKWAIQSLPVDLTPVISDSKLVTEAMDAEPEKCRTWIDALRVIRNHLAHGTKGFDARDLSDVAEDLERVARSHTLRVLGCGSEVLSRVLES